MSAVLNPERICTLICLNSMAAAHGRRRFFCLAGDEQSCGEAFIDHEIGAI